MKNISWDECQKKADAFVVELLKEGHSGQDLVFMGGRLIHAGVYVENRNAEEFVKAHPWDQEKGDEQCE